MKQAVISNPLDALEASAEGARLALACSFSSSQEYEAALIAERRAAGLYGRKSANWQMICGGALMLAICILIAISRSFS